MSFVFNQCVYKNTNFDYISYKSLLPDCHLFDNPKEYVESIFANVHRFSAFRAEKMSMLSEYMLAGGFPSYFETKENTIRQHKLIGDILDKCLFGDILSSYNIKAPENLKKLLFLIASHNGQELAYASLGKNLSLNTVTIISHLAMLNNDRIITICDNYSGSKSHIIRKNKRIIVRDGGIKNALIRKSELNSDEIESEIKNFCVTMASDYAENNDASVYFWRNNQAEVDILIGKGDLLLPVSVIYKNDIAKRDIRGVKAFNRAYYNRKAIIVTKDTLAIEDNIYFVPFWLI